MGGFDKIEFNTKSDKPTSSIKEKINTVPVKSSMQDQKNGSFGMSNRKQQKKFTFKFKWSKKANIVVGIVLLLILLSGIPAFATYTAAMKTKDHAKLLSAALKKTRYRCCFRRSGQNTRSTQRNTKKL